jgi:hypothetical protein
VTLLTRLAAAFERLTEPTVPLCPDCGAPMTLERETPVGDLPAALQRAYVCRRCGAHVSHCVLWATPD